MFAMVAYWMRMSAFGKTIIDGEKITAWSNKIGEVIKSQGSVDNVVKQLEAGQFNSAALTVIDMAIKYTKEFLGANDAALGNIDPERASGTAIMLTAKQAAIPHANVLTNLEQFVEDIYLIWGEFFIKKYKNRELFIKDENNKIASQMYDSSNMSDVLLSCKVNVGPSSTWSETITLQNLDSLAKMGWVKPVQYYERVASMNILPNVQGLIKDAKVAEMAQVEKQKAIEKMQTQAGLIPGVAKSEQPNPMNAPELQGNMGATATNSMKLGTPQK